MMIPFIRHDFIRHPSAGNLVMTSRWFKPLPFIFLLFFSLAWNGFITVHASLFLTGIDQLPVGGLKWLIGLFYLPFIAVGLGMFYTAICLLLNTTTFQVNRQHLAIRHAPLPFPGQIMVATPQIDQFFTERKESRTKQGVSIAFQLKARMKSGRIVPVLTLPEASEALQMEHELESYLGIEDCAVPGEVAKTT